MNLYDEQKPERNQEPSRDLQKRRFLLIVSALVLFAGGFFTNALLSSATSKNSEVQAQTESTLTQPLRALDLDFTDLSINEAYQKITEALIMLASLREGDSSVKVELAALGERIEGLRTLNPYYRFKEIRAKTTPSGVPEVYGQTLGVSFDEVQASLTVLAAYDPTYGSAKITLTDEDLERYIFIGSQTACKYCCTATTLVRKNGAAACSCEHSQAMRGLAAYLITNHPQVYDDNSLVDELNRWRAVFFPKQTLTETLITRQAAGEVGIDAILAEFPEFMPNMVGNC